MKTKTSIKMHFEKYIEGNEGKGTGHTGCLQVVLNEETATITGSDMQLTREEFSQLLAKLSMANVNTPPESLPAVAPPPQAYPYPTPYSR